MFAVSIISTIKVDCPNVKSSLAPYTRENLIHNTQFDIIRRHERTNLREYRNQRVLAHKSRFPRHIRSVKIINSVFPQKSPIYRRKSAPNHRNIDPERQNLFQNRMATVFNDKSLLSSTIGRTKLFSVATDASEAKTSIFAIQSATSRIFVTYSFE